MAIRREASGRSIRSRDSVGTYASIVQARDLAFTRVFVDQPTLIVLRHGIKTIRSGSDEWGLRDGEAIVLMGGRDYDFRNSPGTKGAYAAEWLFWDSALLAKHAALSVGPAGAAVGAQRLGAVGAQFLEALDRARGALCDPDSVPVEVAAHRVTELLVWLSAFGVQLPVHVKPSLKTQVRRMVEADPAQKWSTELVASRLTVSSTSLRRHLAAEGTTLGTLLIDTRMSLAVTLLQSTGAPIGSIALDLGYESASRFAIRFRERFGFPPTSIRGHLRGL